MSRFEFMGLAKGHDFSRAATKPTDFRDLDSEEKSLASPGTSLVSIPETLLRTTLKLTAQ